MRSFLVAAAFATTALPACEVRDHRVPDLVTQLRKSRSTDLRARAAYELGRLRKDTVSYDRMADAIGPLPLDPDEQPIVDALNEAIQLDPDGLVRRRAVWALAQLRPPGRQPGLLACFETNREDSCLCWGALVKFSTDESLEEPIQSIRHLRRRDPLVDRAPRTLQDEKADCVAGAVRQGVPTVMTALETVTRHDPQLVAAALFALYFYKSSEAALILSRALELPDPDLRFSALVALWSGDFTSERGAIERLRDDSDPEVRELAERILSGEPYPL